MIIVSVKSGADTTAWDKLSKDEKEKIQLEDSKINLLTKGCD